MPVDKLTGWSSNEDVQTTDAPGTASLPSRTFHYNQWSMIRQNRREFLTSALGASAGLLACGDRPRLERPPNIVFIMADDLGYGELGSYGQRYIRTPNLDGMATDGMRFTDAYAGCTVCAPSRSVLMTGLHMGHAPVRANTGGVPLIEPDITVAETLKQYGYATGCFGKWGLGDIGTEGVPWNQGFDEFFGYLHQVHAHYYYPAFLYHNDEEVTLPGNEGGGRVTYAHDVIADKALDFIRRRKDQPFFCCVPFTIPHLELLAPEDSMAEYRGQFPEPVTYTDPRDHYAEQPKPRTARAAMITRMDRDVGRILQLLKELALEQDTIVFFTSDNGGSRPVGEDFFQINGGLRGYKRDFHEGGIRVPMIARWPGQVARGTVSDHPWAFWDVFPTLLDLAAIDIPPHTDGISVVQTLLGQGDQRAHEFLYWELPRYNSETGEFADEVPAQAVRWGEWKAVRPEPGGEVELFNLGLDPAETTNVAQANPDVMDTIEEYLRRARYQPRQQTQPEHQWWLGPEGPRTAGSGASGA